MSWNSVVLGDLAVQRGGSVDPKKHPDEVFELYSIPAFDIGSPELILGSKIGSSKKIVEPDDVMVSRIVPHIRRAWVVGPNSGKRQIASGEWIVFRGDNIWPPYLRWVLVGDDFHSAFLRTVSGVGGSLLRARPAEVFKIKVPLPPLPEQKRIAAILDTADALRARRRESIAELDKLVQSTFLEMFGDPVANPKKWKSGKLGDIVDRLDGGKNVAQAEYETVYRVLKVSSVTTGTYRPEESKYLPSDFKVPDSYLVKRGDLLISRANTSELIGAMAYVWETPPNIVLPDKIWKFIWKAGCDVEPLFIYCLSRNYEFRRLLSSRASGTSGSMKNIAKPKLLGLPIPLPPHGLQRRFSRIVEFIEKQRSLLRNHLHELDTLFTSLQYRAFNGEL